MTAPRRPLWGVPCSNLNPSEMPDTDLESKRTISQQFPITRHHVQHSCRHPLPVRRKTFSVVQLLARSSKRLSVKLGQTISGSLSCASYTVAMPSPIPSMRIKKRATSDLTTTLNIYNCNARQAKMPICIGFSLVLQIILTRPLDNWN